MTAPRKWRVAHGFSQAAIASRLGVKGRNPARTWQRWERGEAAPPVSIIVNVEKISRGEVTAADWLTVRQARRQTLMSSEARNSGGNAHLRRVSLTESSARTVEDAFSKWLKIGGGPNALARQLGVSAQVIKQWERIPAGWVLAVEIATGVPRHELRPDLYPIADALAQNKGSHSGNRRSPEAAAI